MSSAGGRSRPPKRRDPWANRCVGIQVDPAQPDVAVCWCCGDPDQYRRIVEARDLLLAEGSG